MTRSTVKYGLIALTLSVVLTGAAFADTTSNAGEVTNAVVPTAPGAPGTPGTPGAPGAPGAPIPGSSATMSSANVSADSATAPDTGGGTDATPAAGDSSGTGLKNTGGEPLIVSMLGLLALGGGLVLRRKLA